MLFFFRKKKRSISFNTKNFRVNSINKILIIRLDRLGDSILSLPVLSNLRKEAPSSKIVVISAPIAEEMFKITNLASEVIVYKQEDENKLLEYIKMEKFDLSITLTEKLIGYEIPFKCQIPSRVGFCAGFSQPIKSVLSGFFCNILLPTYNNPKVKSENHEIERYLILLKKIGIKNPSGNLEIPIKDEDVADFNKLMPPNPKIAVQLNSSWFKDGWDKSSFVSLLQKLKMEFPLFSIILFYGDFEEKLICEIKEPLENLEIILFKPENFKQWASGIKSCKVLLSVDTGAVHLASALKVPVLDIFISENFEHVTSRWYPWQTPYRIMKKDKYINENTSLAFNKNVIFNLKSLLEEIG